MGNTKALLHFNGINSGITIIDSTGYQPWERVGSAVLSTSQVWGGMTSLWQSNVTPLNSGVQATTNANFLPGTNDFTVEARIRGLDGATRIFFNEAANPGIQLTFSAGKKVSAAMVAVGSTVVAGDNTVLGTSAWYHIALVRSGTSLTVYINGTAETTVGNAGTLSAIGSAGTAQVGFGNAFGYIDEFRYSNTARWTSNFTPPTSQYQLVNLMPSIFN